jgi:hypothetical protein
MTHMCDFWHLKATEAMFAQMDTDVLSIVSKRLDTAMNVLPKFQPAQSDSAAAVVITICVLCVAQEVILAAHPIP